MYTYKERMRAEKAYIASGYQANKTIQEQGYPSHEALHGWYQEYQKNRDLHWDFIRAALHTQEQKEKAVAHYYANGCNYTKTSKALGAIRTSHNARLANSMLDATISQLRKGEHPILHSDRGGHYR